MAKLSPSDFKDHADWIAYVRQSVPESEQAYTLANGRTELFIRLCKARKQNVPAEYERERQHIETLTDPMRSAALEQLNKRIFADLIQQMFARVPVKGSDHDAALPPTPRQQVDELVQHLVQKNPFFARWKKQQLAGREVVVASSDSDFEVSEHAEFSFAMTDLDHLLTLYRDRDQALPLLTFERVWFLHYLREPERMLQTRAVLNMLMAELASCTSA